MVAEALVADGATNVRGEQRHYPKSRGFRMTLNSPDPSFAAPPFKQLTMTSGSPKFNRLNGFRRRRGGNCKILEQFENWPSLAELRHAFGVAIRAAAARLRPVIFIVLWRLILAPSPPRSAFLCATKAANSCGDPGRNRTFSLARLCLASCERRMSFSVALSLSIDGTGHAGRSHQPGPGVAGELGVARLAQRRHLGQVRPALSASARQAPGACLP